ncbi:RNA polymerase alpha subunit [Limnobacter thiooxidans]|uniref:RNA polymerase alpha subunit C-terminal domain-containing protein n=1 Tax=Limnobacter thiooxidans TaxID=131080 RepID=A0AA86MIN5_9BURK|nr:RNA polymerase alpha subunit [Limnobacter thiooxidans]BET26487.1 hypothetical protein RGQ30_19880 [Limnobacter thiooxidans]
MEKEIYKSSINFTENLKDDFIGLPHHIITIFANNFFKKSGFDLIHPIDKNLNKIEINKYQEEIQEFLNCSTFAIKELNKEINFKGIFSTDEKIELSTIYKNTFDGNSINIKLKNTQYQSGKNWLLVRKMIDSIELRAQVRKILEALNERDREIITKAYGLYIPKEQSIQSIAEENNLGKARIYQILKDNETTLKRKFLKAIIKEKELNKAAQIELFLDDSHHKKITTPESIIVIFLKAIYINSLEKNISIRSVLDFIQLNYKEELKLIHKVLPIFNSTRMFCKIIRESVDPRLSAREIELKTPLLSNLALIDRINEISITTLPLSKKAISCLEAVGIRQIGQLAKTTLGQLLRTPNLGTKDLLSIQQFFDLYKGSNKKDI